MTKPSNDTERGVLLEDLGLTAEELRGCTVVDARAEHEARTAAETALKLAGFRVAPDYHGTPTLWCIECTRDSGFHWAACSKAKNETQRRLEDAEAALAEERAKREAAERRWEEPWPVELQDRAETAEARLTECANRLAVHERLNYCSRAHCKAAPTHFAPGRRIGSCEAHTQSDEVRLADASTRV